MGKVNQLWQDELERTCTAMLLNHISREEFKIRMRKLGMDEQEIQDHIDAVSQFDS